MNENMGLQEVNDEDEEECVEAPVDDVEDDVPMADEWVNFTYEIFWQVFECRPVAECRRCFGNVEDVHELMIDEVFEVENYASGTPPGFL